MSCYKVKPKFDTNRIENYTISMKQYCMETTHNAYFLYHNENHVSNCHILYLPYYSIDWMKVLEGCVLSMGQVYAVQNIITSIIMWAAVFLYNPVLALLSALGAIIGTFLPLAFLGFVKQIRMNQAINFLPLLCM